MDIYGIIGYPIKHSLSPAMHNAAFKVLGKKFDIEAEYRKFEIKPEELEDFLLKDITVKDTEGREVRTKEIIGFNVTIPHKVRAKEILEKNYSLCCMHPRESVLQDVRLSGAINTIGRRNDKLWYCNTDVYGFSSSLNEEKNKTGGRGFETRDKAVFVIGCGGAGRSVITGLIWHWDNPHVVKKIYIYDTNKEILESTVGHFLEFPALQGKLEPIYKIEDIPRLIRKCNLLVNASPVGMKEGDDRAVIDKNLLHEDLSVYDVVYNRETQLIKDARSQSLYCAGGKGMLLYQAVHALELWKDIKKLQDSVVEAMRKALDKV